MDERIIEDIVAGFRLVGMQEASGLFPEEVNIPTMTEKQLECQYDFSRRVLLDKIASSRFDKEVWDATMEETESPNTGFSDITLRFGHFSGLTPF